MEHLIINHSSSLIDAIKVLDKNGHGFLAIIDDEAKLHGILTDGDVRRAVLDDKKDLLSAMNRNPMTMQLGTSADSIIYKLKKNRKKHMPIVDGQGVLHDVFTLDDIDFNLKPNYIVIMAGGLGSRMGELTHNTPKPMLPLGKRPMLERIIDSYKSFGFNKFIISVNYKSDVIKEYFGSGDSFGVEINYLEERQKLGTAGALGLIRQDLCDPFFVSYGDVLASIDFHDLLMFHEESSSVATMCIKRNTYQIPYGVVDVDNDGNILHFKEKPESHYFVNAGIYVLNPEVVQLVSEVKYRDMPSVFEMLKSRNSNTKSYEIDDYWIDMGYPKDYHSAKFKFDRFESVTTE